MTLYRAGCKRDLRAAPLATRVPSRGYSDGDDGTLRGSPASMFIYLFIGAVAYLGDDWLASSLVGDNIVPVLLGRRGAVN
jgi:hypothetical protein